MKASYDLGLEGEKLACEQLCAEGCRILATRWKLHHLELDIVATDGQSFIVAEVKTRKAGPWGDPLDAVTPRKIQNLVRAADAYMQMYHIDLPYRFDLFSIIIDQDGHASIEHLKDAFYPPLG
jgi:putative endonuclease